ncbi:DNA polymerase III subunit gamma and tau [Corynebacterium pacaense]|uniref:DNA polymerase III subunit gamma and tau n=1 Tax=Corynebacterium pacaense TaxID=1816684 RepID=UPI0009BAAC0E|nr:DNA polymerase III subunit gamma and tau [Corynebacterium pacaense]
MALYRKYRPASFDEVVGQDHVTRPLSAALDSGRINHAYLFSGPRGCGKTSSARILARSLNCVQGPTSHPCGVCNSCIALAPGGPGTLDVTELDAATHNGVDEMRELRDRAQYAPAESRYRIFIIDEAHMISRQGFNAMLKTVEEPPEHVIFIFATTEPEKLLDTIRSRTHHYPFRLLTPQAMRGLLERTCRSEGIAVEDAVFPLVIRAGGGSPRDSLSVLDQLLAGSGPEGLTYQRALPLLGVTDSTLIDDALTALATKDNAAMFTTIDRVIEAGHDPRRFATDLLDRLRDLMILQAVPDAFELGLVDAPADRTDVLRGQAAMFNGNELSTLALMVNSGLDDMRGATSPRLLLEVLCARLLLSAGNAVPTPVVPEQPKAAPAPVPGGAAAAARAAARAASQTYGQRSEPQPTPVPEPAPEPVRETPEQAPEPEDILSTIRSQWAHLRSLVGRSNTHAEIMLTEAKVLGLRDGTLVLGHSTGALANRLNAPEHNASIVKVIADELGRKLSVECVVGTDPSAAGFTAESAEPAPPRPAWNPAKSPREPHAAPEEPESPETEPKHWGAPVELGGTPAPAAPPAPPAPVVAQPDASKPSWKEIAANAAASIANQRSARQGSGAPFEGGVPLPPEPVEEEPADDPYGYPADEGIPEPSGAAEVESEEEQMIRQAQEEPGEMDRRDARAIAMELLAAELGAKPL